MIDTPKHPPKRRRFLAAGHRLPSGIFIRPEPLGNGIGYTANIGKNTVKGSGLRQFWENVGVLFRNRARWAEKNNRPLAIQSELLLDAFDAEDYALELSKPEKNTKESHK